MYKIVIGGISTECSSYSPLFQNNIDFKRIEADKLIKHIDFDFSHKGAILYINSCNGYTKLEDGTKIDSVANRILFFDPSTPHCSTTTSDTTARFNINFNYF